MTIDPRLVTTALEIHGYRLVKSLGMVRGIVVRSRSVIGTFGASLQTLIGGDITLFTSLCERTREDAYERMVLHARERGANAVDCHALRRQRGDGWGDRSSGLWNGGRRRADLTGVPITRRGSRR